MAQSRLFAGAQGKRAKQGSRAAELADSAQRVFASLGAADLEA
jgi:hypothetical protein